jgi:hypothetical protein
MAETAACHVCGDTYPLDGEQAIERFGNPLCRDCADESVVFVARCQNGLCGWSYRVDETEFNRGHAKTRAQQEANSHQTRKREFDDDPTHRTTVEEADPDA